MTFAEIRAADLLEIEADLPATFTHSTGSGACIPTMLHAGDSLLVGGTVVTIKRNVIVRVALFSAVPSAGQYFTLNSSEFRIADVKTSADGVHYEIALMDLSQK